MSDENTKVVTFEWQGHVIEVRYAPNYFEAYREIYGHALAHIEVRAKERQPLPITETGYLSHFTNPALVAEYGGAEAFIRDWLDVVAQSDEWKAHTESARQFSLF